MRFLENILGELRVHGLVHSKRGSDGGYWLAREPGEIGLAEIIRAVEGPLATVRGESADEIEYRGESVALREVWLALRANIRQVLETVTLADVVAGELPESIRKLAELRGEPPARATLRPTARDSVAPDARHATSRRGSAFPLGLLRLGLAVERAEGRAEHHAEPADQDGEHRPGDQVGEAHQPPLAPALGQRQLLRARRVAVLVEDPRAARLHIDDLTVGELELLDLRPRQLRDQRNAVAEAHLDPHLEAEVDDPVDHRLHRPRSGHVGDLHVVRADERLADPVGGADEAHHELRLGMVVEVGRPAGLLDRAVVHDHDLLGDVHRLLLIVGDEDRRHVDLVVEPAQPLAQLGAHARVERPEGLVEQQHLGLDRERPGERHALALAAGELARVAVREALELDQLEQLLDPILDLLLAAACGSGGRRRRCRARSCA